MAETSRSSILPPVKHSYKMATHIYSLYSGKGFISLYLYPLDLCLLSALRTSTSKSFFPRARRGSKPSAYGVRQKEGNRRIPGPTYCLACALCVAFRRDRYVVYCSSNCSASAEDPLCIVLVASPDFRIPYSNFSTHKISTLTT